MKDAFGGSFILRIMLVFFVVFICFMTVAINLSKTYRIKNNVINILERSNPNDFSKEGDSGTINRIDSYLNKVAYNYYNNENVKGNCAANNRDRFLSGNGVCIIRKEDNNNVYYRVITYFVVDFPLFRLGILIPISGETKTIYY